MSSTVITENPEMRQKLFNEKFKKVNNISKIVTNFYINIITNMCLLFTSIYNYNKFFKNTV